MIKKYFEKIWSQAYKKNDEHILRLLEKNKKAHVLDIGCGDGQKTIKFKSKIGCKTIYGIDGVKERLVAAKKRGIDKTKKVNLETKWPFESNFFDIIVSNQVIEHVADIDNFIKETKRLLKPGGYAVISTENLASWHNIFALILGYQDFSHHTIMKKHVGNPLSPHFNEKTLTWSKKDNSGVDDTAYPHLKVPTFYSFLKSFEEYGFKVEKSLASGYYPLPGIVGDFFSKLNPRHSHFITAKFRKV